MTSFGQPFFMVRAAFAPLLPPFMSALEGIEVETSVRNIGPREGLATLFLFIRDPVASIARPVLELKGFEKVALAAGEERRVRFELERGDLAFLGAGLEPVVEPGRFEVHVGLSADPSGLRSASFVLD